MTVSVAALVPLLVLLAVGALVLWVYSDATAQEKQGTPVMFSIGALTIDTPAAWALGCLVLFVVFVPLYLSSRHPTTSGKG